MLPLFLQAYWKLVFFDFFLIRGRFDALHRTVRACPTRRRMLRGDVVRRVCSAVDMACIWYWKEALCLQRSAATACLLREHGVSARLVIGAQQLPFKAHAWVEVEGVIVNDKPYMPEIYAVIEEC